MKRRIFSILFTLVLVLGLSLLPAVPAAANDATSSTMIFEGAVTDVGGGVYIGTIDMTPGVYYIVGGPGEDEFIGDPPRGIVQGGFDVYAKVGGTAYIEGYGIESWVIGGDHDAYSETGGPWGAWFDPDCADWDMFSLELTEDHWYLRYTSTGESPMSGVMYWYGDGTGYAAETDPGTVKSDHGGTTTDPTEYTAGSAQEWGWHCGWGEERIPLEFPGFAVDIAEDGGVYTVTLTPTIGPVTNTNTGLTYGTIQLAIDASETGTGDTIDVADGTYTITRTIDVGEEVTITGDTSSPENVVVQYSPADITQPIFEITASNVTIEGIKTISGKYAVLFESDNPTGCTISHCILDEPGRRGINFWSGCGTGHTVEYTTISNVGPYTDEGETVQETGIMIYYPSGALDLTIQHNTFTNMYRGIWLYAGNSIVIDSNTFTSIKDQGNPGNVYNGAPAIDLHNSAATSTGNRVEVTNNTVSDCYWQGILVVKCPYTYVYNNTVSNCNYYGQDGTGDWDYAAIHVQDYPNHGDTPSVHCIIDNNTVFDSINGIQIWSDDCQVTNNEIYDMGKTYADTKVVGERTYKNSAILVGTNFGNPTIEHDPTGVVIRNNDIHDNYWGLFHSADLSNNVTATNNWWGDISGPQHETTWGEFPMITTNPGGTGDSVSDSVNYMPWLTRPFETVLADEIAYWGIPMIWLNTGWNTFSTPIALDSACDTWGEYITLGDGLAIHATSPAYAFDGVAQEWVPLNGDNADYRLKPCDAIYVRMDEPDIAAILLSPDVSVPSKDLYVGWNLVSLAYLPMELNGGMYEMPYGQALDTVYKVTGDLIGYSLVVSPPVNWFSWFALRDNLQGEGIMHITEGYWVFMKNPGTLAGFSMTPIPLGMR